MRRESSPGGATRPALRSVCLAGAGLLLLLLQSGCVAVGYRSGGGWFVWPGGLGLLVIVLLLIFLLRRGR